MSCICMAGTHRDWSECAAYVIKKTPSLGVPTGGVPRVEGPFVPYWEREEAQAPDPLGTQVGGDHYKKLKIQPVEYIVANNIPFIEGNVIKYVSRWRNKGGLQDIDKAIHWLQVLKQMETEKA